MTTDDLDQCPWCWAFLVFEEDLVPMEQILITCLETPLQKVHLVTRWDAVKQVSQSWMET